MSVTQNKIARITGLSRSTVSTILAGKFARNYKKETRKLVLETAQRMGYRPNQQALMLKTGKSNFIGIVHTGSILPLTHLKISRVVEEVISRGLEPLVYHNTWFENSARVIGILLDNQVQGVVLINNYYEGQTEELKRLTRAVPVVQFGGLKEKDIPLVAPDTARGMEEVVRHLTDEGWRNLCLLAPYAEDSLLNPVAAFRKARLPKSVRRKVVVVPWEEGDRHDVFAPGGRGLEHLRRLAGQKTAVIAHDDNWAIGFYLRCLREGLQIPADFGLTGYDNILLGRKIPAALTTVEQPVAAMARRTVELLMLPEYDPDATELMPCTLIVRDSCCGSTS